MITLCAEFITPSDHSVCIRVDPAPAFQRLSKDDILRKNGMQLMIGYAKNVNTNPIAERAIQELGLEFLRI